jgi:hypothetical protein
LYHSDVGEGKEGERERERGEGGKRTFIT